MNFENLEEIIDFAIEKEREAAEFYADVSEMEPFSGSSDMLKDFSKEERKHEKLLLDLKNDTIDDSIKTYKFKWIPDIKRSDYVDDIEYAPGLGYKDLLLLAMKREEKALALYNMLLDKAKESGATDAATKVLKLLCQEEAKHKLALETMYDDYMAEMGD